MEPNEILKSLRESKKLTMKEVSEKTGMATALVSDYETGKKKLGLKVAIRFADLYKVSLDYLLGRPEAKPPEDPIIALCDAFHLPEQDRAIVAAYLYMSDKDRAELLRLVKKLAESAEPKPQENTSIEDVKMTTNNEIQEKL